MKKQITRILSVFLTVLMLAGTAVAAIPASAADYEGTYDTFANQMLDTGVASYYVEDEADFVTFLTEVRSDAKSGDKFKGKTVYITNDITLNDEWVKSYPADITTTAVTAPTEDDAVIFYTATSEIGGFAGTLDGMGHTVQGIYAVDKAGTEPGKRAGSLFGRGTNATVKNVAFDNCYIASSLVSMGGFFGIASADSTTTFINVYNGIDLEYTGSSTSLSMGGFIGYNGSEVSFIDTVYAGTIKQGDANASSITAVGGFIGTAIKYSIVNFENVANLGNINMPAASGKIGKLIGAFSNAFTDGQDSVMELTVENCIIGGEITAKDGVPETLVGFVNANYTTTSTTVTVDNVLLVAARDGAQVVPECINAGSGDINVTYSIKNYKTVADVSTAALAGSADVAGQSYNLEPYFTKTADGPMPTNLLYMGGKPALEDEAQFLGYQVKAVDGGYNLRLIALGTTEELSSVGMSVSIAIPDGRTVSGSATTTKVYKGIIVGEEGGEDDYVAPDGKYVYTLVAGTLTDDLGTVTVYVTTFYTDANGKTVNSSYATRTLDTSKLAELAGSAGGNDSEPEEEPVLTLAKSGATDYKLYSKLDSTVTSAFQTAFQNKTGVTLSTTTTIGDKTIILGTGEDFASVSGANIAPTYSSYQIKVVGNSICVAVASNSFTDEQSTLAANAASKLFGALTSRFGAYTLDRTFEAVGDTTGVTEIVPVHTMASGQSFEEMYDSKNDGVISRQVGYKGATSATNSIDAYAARLEALGYTLHDTNTINGNKFATYTNDEQNMTVHLNWFKSKGIFRIIYNTVEYLPAASLPKAGTDYTAIKTPTLSMLQLDVASPGGLSMVAQLEDGSFIIIDGGIKKDIHKTRLLNFLNENKPAGEAKARVTWIFTHNHGDHVNNAIDFMQTKASAIDLGLVIINYPDYATVGFGTLSLANSLMNTISTYHPNATIYVPHAGEQLFFPGLEIEIYFTQEEMIDIDTTDVNNTSLVFKMKFATGKTCMVFGDSLAPATTYAYALYGATLKSDIMQVPHHGAITGKQNSHYTALYAAVDPSICLWSTEKEKFENDASHRMGCCTASKTSYLANYNLRNKAGVKHYHHSQITTINMTNLSVTTEVVA